MLCRLLHKFFADRTAIFRDGERGARQRRQGGSLNEKVQRWIPCRKVQRSIIFVNNKYWRFRNGNLL
jgi:hypothetical protein